jgi:hypothetical protein
MQGAFQQPQAAPAAWAADFMQNVQPAGMQKSGGNLHVQMDREMNMNAAVAASAGVSAAVAQQWANGPSPMFSPFAQRPMQGYVPPMHMMQQQPQQATQHDRTPHILHTCTLTKDLFYSTQRSYGTALSRPQPPRRSSKHKRHPNPSTRRRSHTNQTSSRAPRACCSTPCAMRRRRTPSFRTARSSG